MADYTVENHGTIFLFRSSNPEALQNLRDHTNEEAQWLGEALAVEHRYAAPLAKQLQEEGWEVE